MATTSRDQRVVDSDDSLGDSDNGYEPTFTKTSVVSANSKNNQAVPAVMELDHEFMTYVFNIFSPLMCFSYTDAVDDLHYVASKKSNVTANKNSKSKSTPKNGKKSKEESTSTKENTAGSTLRKSKSIDSPKESTRKKEADATTTTKSKKLEKRKSSANDLDGNLIPCESSQEIKHTPIDPVALREIELENFAQEAFQKGLLYFGYRSDPKHPLNWELQKHASEVKVYTTQFEPEDYQHVVKSHYTVNFSLDVVLQSLIDEKFLMDLDTSLESFKMLQANAPNMICREYAYKSYWPISPRDFVVLTCWNKLEDGCTMLTTVSVPNEWCPVSSSHVRAYIVFSGSLLKPLDDNTTEITMMNHSKLESSIPVSLINSTAVGIPITFVNHFRKFLKTNEAALKTRIK